MANLNNLVINIEANIARFMSDMDRAAQQTEQAMAQMEGAAGMVTTALGAIGIGLSVDALIGAVNKSLDALATLDDMAQKTGSSIENLSKLSKVAAMTGTDFGMVDAAMAKLARGMVSVDVEGSKVKKAMDALGLSTNDLKHQDPSEVFVQLAKGLQNYEDGAGKVALMTDAMGKSGADLLPYMNDVAESIDKFTGDSAAAAAAAAKYQDELGLLRVKHDELVTSITMAALPAMNDFVGALSDVMKESKDLSGVDVAGWSDDIAVGMARVVDVALVLPKIFSAVASSFQVAYADIRTLTAMSPAVMAVKLANGGSPLADLKQEMSDREKILAGANVKWDTLWNKPANQMEQAVLNRIAGRNTGGENAIDAMVGMLGPDGKKKTLAYAGDDSGKGPADDPAKKQFEGHLKALEAALAQEQSELEFGNKYIAELRSQDQISLEMYNDYRQQSLDSGLAIAVKAYDAEIAEAERYRDSIVKLSEKASAQNKVDEARAKKSKAIQDAGNQSFLLTLDLSKAQGDLNKSMEDWNRQQTASALQMQFGIDLYGKSVLEVERLTNARRIELDIEEKIRAAREKGAITDEAIARYRQDGADQTAVVNGIATQARGQQIGRDQRLPDEIESERHDSIIKDLQAFQALKLENVIEGNRMIEEENRRHSYALVDIETAAQMQKLSMMSESSGQLYDVLKQSGMEQSALGRTLFFVNKALAVAEIIMNTEVAAAKALTFGPVIGPIMAGTIRVLGYASAGITAGLAVASAEGGYDIPAGVNPMTQLHEQEMVLPKQQANVIRDMAKNGTGPSGPASVTVNVAVDAKGSSVEGNDRQAKQLGDMVSNAVRNILVQEQRPGGILA